MHACTCIQLCMYAICVSVHCSPAGVPKSPPNAGLQSEGSFIMWSSFESLFSDILLKSINSRELNCGYAR
jgi:hypothetical protein